MTDDYAYWLKDNPAPDLQAMVRLAGERYAASLGVPYDPTNPEHGGYQHITETEWKHYDAAMADWQARRRARYGRHAVAPHVIADPSPSTAFEACATCGQEAHFGYRDKHSGMLVWFCDQHRSAQWWADARR